MVRGNWNNGLQKNLSVTNINFLIVNESKSKPPSLPFDAIKESILGGDYDLSLIFANDEKIAELNKKYRGKDGTTDVLSFPISEKNGEVYISIKESEKRAGDFGYKNSSKKIAAEETTEIEKFIGFLFIHAMLHLKGYSHGSTMEQEETKFVKKFRLSPSGV